MKLLLVFLLAMVVLGLCTNRLDWRVYGLVCGMALMTTGAYFVAERFMS